MTSCLPSSKFSWRFVNAISVLQLLHLFAKIPTVTTHVATHIHKHKHGPNHWWIFCLDVWRMFDLCLPIAGNPKVSLIHIAKSIWVEWDVLLLILTGHLFKNITEMDSLIIGNITALIFAHWPFLLQEKHIIIPFQESINPILSETGTFFKELQFLCCLLLDFHSMMSLRGEDATEESFFKFSQDLVQMTFLPKPVDIWESKLLIELLF